MALPPAAYTPQTHRQNTLHLSLVTPAFLGDACQRSQWRTPPLKALLRQWWRIAAAPDHDYKYEALREAEGRLFGHAWLENAQTHKTWAMQGQVRLRLKEWGNEDRLESWDNDPRVSHPEVRQPVGSQLYLGYGPLTYQGGTQLKQPPAIKDRASNALRMLYPTSASDQMTKMIALINWFGTVGGRSRNGWGSLRINGMPSAFPAAADPVVQACSRDFQECLSLDWAHAIGRDAQGPLIWHSNRPHDDWSSAMEELARIKIAFRTQFNLTGGNQLQRRHLLAYPVTNHMVGQWGNTARLANQLRFRVSQDAQGSYYGLAVHLPHKLPRLLHDKLRQQDQERASAANQLSVWQQVHRYLNGAMQRIAKP